MVSKRLAVSTLLALSLAACGGGRREGPPPRPIPPEVAKSLKASLMERFDQNGDGIADCDDTAIARRKLFEQLDSDQSRTLDEDEFRAAPFEDRVYVFHRFELLDKNGDEVLDLPEFAAPADNTFLAADIDKNCILSDEELTALMRDTARFDIQPREKDKNRRKPQVEPEPF